MIELYFRGSVPAPPLLDLLSHIYFFNSNIRACDYYFRIAIYHIQNQSVFILYIMQGIQGTILHVLPNVCYLLFTCRYCVPTQLLFFFFFFFLIYCKWWALSRSLVLLGIKTFSHVFLFPVVKTSLPYPGNLGWRQAE